MFILSQDKTRIINFDECDSVAIYEVNSNFEILANNSSILLGKYSKFEIAQKVLKKIFEQCLSSKQYIMPKDDEEEISNY